MKLQEIHTYAPGNSTYSSHLRDKGFKRPELKGSGYALVIYTPNPSIRYYDSLRNAQEDVPKQPQTHWQVVNVKTGDVEKEPEWWHLQAYSDYVHRGQK